VTVGTNSPAAQYYRLAILLLALNMLSAIAFVAVVRHPVYDDGTNILDVKRYAKEGVTWQSIRSHLNPTGPGSFLWMAAGVRFLGGTELPAARIAVLGSWLILGVGILVGARRTETPELWYAALATTLVFPHSMTATATLMTEGPALLAALLATFAWTAFVALPRLTVRGLLLALLAGLALGLAVTCRQYYLALLPSALLVAFFLLPVPASQARAPYILTVLGSLLLAMIPVGLLILAWHGLSSPSMAAGTSYKQWRAAVGLNLTRPMIATLYIAVYLLPFTFPVPMHARFVKRLVTICGAAAAGATAAYFRDNVLQPGPLHSLEEMASHFWRGQFLVVAVLTALASYNGVTFVMLVWRRRASVLENPVVLFSLFVLVFFVIEQLGIGGNIPFYDRYIMQLAPFLAFITFGTLPGLGALRLITFALLALLSHGLLWRNAFGG